MEVARVVSDSAHYAAQFSSEFGKLIILAILALIPVVNFMVLGYLARIMRMTPSNNLPTLDRWGEMFADGLKLLLVSLCYLLAGIVVTILLYYVGSVLMALLGLFVCLIGYLLLPMALVHSVKTGDPSKGFALGEILTKVVYVGWFDYIVLILVILILPAVLVLILVWVPILGWLILFLVGPAIGTFAARAAALAYPQ